MTVLPVAHQSRLEQVAALLHARGMAGWLVGGYVRDLLRGVGGSDIDVAVDGPAMPLARELADQTGGALVVLDETTDTARVVWTADAASPLVLDLVRLRASSIEQDLALRDFTINALAMPLLAPGWPVFRADQVVDVVGSRADLAAGRVRMCGSSTLTDDPLRMLRAVRFAAQLGFVIEPNTSQAIRSQAILIAEVARERVRDELLKLLAVRHAAPFVALLDELGLLTRIVPELEPARNCAQPSQHVLPVLGHLLETVAAWEWLFDHLAAAATELAAVNQRQPAPGPLAVQRFGQLKAELPEAARLIQRMEQPLLADQPRYVFFKLAVLLHDVGKPPTQQVRADGRITFYDHQEVGAELVGQIARRLRIGREATAYLQLVVREHMRPGQLRSQGSELTRRAIFRLLRDTGEAVADVLLHSLCDHMAARGFELSEEDWQHHVAWTAAVLRECWQAPAADKGTRLITGNDLIRELGIAPGPLIGQMLAQVSEAHFMGEVQTRAEALALAARIARSKANEVE